jgi:hypothetical protein
MVNAVISAYNRLPTPDIALIGAGGGVSGGAPGAISGGGSNAAILSAVTGLSGITSGISGLAGAAGGKAGTSANKAALAKLQADAEMLGALVDQLTGANQYASTFSSDSAAARAERAFQASAINITVNGAIDSESTARQIVEILNDSAARGTVGAGKLNLLP